MIRAGEGYGRRIRRTGLMLMLVSGMQGCASYYSHFAMFPAENSAGEARQVRISWQTAEYPGWWFADDKASTIKVETQCSERVWRLSDSSQDEARACGGDIGACAEPRMDRLAGTNQPAAAEVMCMAINPGDHGRITGLRGVVELQVYCEPVSTRQGEGDKAVNTDYVRPSVVPYQVPVRRVERGSAADRLPELDDVLCKHS
ncbi:hypothetical protein [Marinobacter profundi]|nr:hypothetical protein [Marinobacter profundi]